MRFFLGNRDKKSPADSASATASTLANLRETSSNLEKREAVLQRKYDELTEQAVAYQKKGQKQLALNQLKRRKIISDDIAKLQGMRFNIETQMHSIESAAITADTMDSLKRSAETQKKIYNNMDQDMIDDVMDDIREAADVTQEISNSLAAPLFNIDEDELLDELENEISSAVEDSLFDVSTPASSKHAQYDLPAVPTHRNTADLLPPVPQSSRHQQESDSEEDELSKLRNEMMLS
ncbi:hypothetical protein H696_03880 [Fonticula alba]|uniref:Charged multivesicular body protein 4 n=1 Tax=Fonticula alba TaxID=691883 RepID=A0A058Z5S2_FONAL|nr:hypothetical protein H696_03880 [Fonticula alba]KCV69451.1 hypothetical protein H696_03880 [Fonticula alba]|eukprot:XP_009496016.1 hypothetical protein H696_03880 [Fonticula alba]